MRDNPERAAVQPEAIAHHFTEAGLDDAAIEWWGRAGDQALRRSAFQEAIAHLGKAIELADKSAAPSSAGEGKAAFSAQRLKLQTDYGQAVMWSRGFAAEEARVSFARATELAADSSDFLERFAAAHGLWTSKIVRSELRPAREIASAFLTEAEEAGRVVEVGVARRGLALMNYFLGDFLEARRHCEQALAACDHEHEEEARNRYGEYTETLTAALLAVADWQLGKVERASEKVRLAHDRAIELGHPPSIAMPLSWKATLDIYRGDAAAALTAADALRTSQRETRDDLLAEHGPTVRRLGPRPSR